MNIFYTLRILFCIALLPVTSYGQNGSFAQLEEKVYQLNNKLKYGESQALLLPVLENENFGAEDKFQAAVLLSYTYKRVFDYQSTLKFLAVARQFAEQTAKKKEYLASIQAEEALVYFDRQEYRKADQLMNGLEATGFRYISLENRAKLVMQQGYLFFLDKQYEQARAAYDRAIVLMRASAPCHLPMIFVKQMQLYDAMNRFDLLKQALNHSVSYADSCHIIKYHLYTYEELKKIYQSRDDVVGMAQVNRKLDSLNLIYAREENISALHNQREELLLKNDDRKLQREQNSRRYLTVGLVGVFTLLLALLGWLFIYRRRQRRMEAEFRRIKSELEAYLKSGNTGMPNESPLAKNHTEKLSERQREVLDYMARGMSNKAIADKLFISENTVKYHIKNIYLLLEIKDRKEFLVNIKK